MPDNPGEGPAARARLDSVDLLRGLAMVVMALDHVRDYFHGSGFYFNFDPTDLSRTYTALFATRWVTHFCAPVFIFLAGTGAFLSASRGKSKPELSKFLLTRGLWLVLLELTYLHVAWYFDFILLAQPVQVIWCLGWSMVALSALIYLPVWAVTAFGVAMIGVHNLFDGVQAQNLGAFGWLWKIFHEGGLIMPSKYFGMYVAYPLIPWIGVMAVGIRLREIAASRSRRAPQMDVRARRRPHPPVRHPPRHQSLRRSDAVERSEKRALHVLLFHQHLQIPAVAFVSPHDARPRHRGARAVRSGPGMARPPVDRIRTSPPVLLSAARSAHPRFGRRLRFRALRSGRRGCSSFPSFLRRPFRRTITTACLWCILSGLGSS